MNVQFRIETTGKMDGHSDDAMNIATSCGGGNVINNIIIIFTGFAVAITLHSVHFFFGCCSFFLRPILLLLLSTYDFSVGLNFPFLVLLSFLFRMSTPKLFMIISRKVLMN